MTGVNYKELLALLAPELILVIGALAVLFADQSAILRFSLRVRNLMALSGAATACIAASLWLMGGGPSGRFFNGMLVAEPLSECARQAILWLAVFCVFISTADRFTRHIGEFYALLLLATTGLILMVSTEDLLVAFISLELSSLCLYVLAGFDKANRASAEASLKYFLAGSTAAAMTLFGISLLFGLAGSTSYQAVAVAAGRGAIDPLLILAVVLTAAGFAFKIAAVPFHFWAPDAYQGAPAPSAAFFASASKLASFFLFGKIFSIAVPIEGLLGAPAFVLLAVLSAASMLFGNIGAVGQLNLRRLIAYSAIAQAGYALLGTLAGMSGLPAVIYHMFTYGLGVAGIFGIIHLLERTEGELQLADLAGLGRSSPLLAFALMIFVLSLAGIPPLAGFFGKFYLFLAALQHGPPDLGLLWLVIAAIGASALSLYYYLQILKHAWVVEPEVEPLQPIPNAAGKLAVYTLAILVIIFGMMPELLLAPLHDAIKAHPGIATVVSSAN